MKTLKYIAVITMAVAGLTWQVGASLINLGEKDLGSVLGNPTSEKTFIESDQSLASGSLTYLNKFDVGTGFENGGAVSDTHFGVTILPGGANALVSWDLAGTGFQLNYVLTKDGVDSQTKLFLYHLYGVTPDQAFNSITDQLVTINGEKAISHISFFGTPGSVPDAGMTVALLGLGLAGIGAMRRFMA